MNSSEFKLTELQNAAIDLMEDETQVKLVEGYAGTGKTTAIVEFCRCTEKRVVVTAPTNKAVKVIRDKLFDAGIQNVFCCTIYSFLGLKLQRKGTKQVITQDIRNPGPFTQKDWDIVLIDETSMVNEQLYKFIIKDLVEQWDYEVCFIGDPKQLPPVGEKYSLTFDTENKVEITEVVRQAEDNPIIRLSIEIRQMIDEGMYWRPQCFSTNTPELSWEMGLDGEKRLLEQFFNSEEYKKDNNYCRYLAWTNKMVDRNNEAVRRIVHGESSLPEFIAGETIVTTAPIVDESGKILAMTDNEFVIDEVRSLTWSNTPVHRLHLRADRPLVLQVVAAEGQRDWKRYTDDLAKKCRSKITPWREFYAWTDSFHQVKHSHALTVHRSQGSTFENTIVNVNNINSNRNTADALRCLYVACTRPSKRLVLLES